MKYEVEMKQVVMVEFSDIELATKYFVGEDAEHAKWFFESDELSEVAEHLSHTFNHCQDTYVNSEFAKFIEGFAPFIRKDTWVGERLSRLYISESDEYGAIILTEIQELEVDYVSETRTIKSF